MLQIASVLTIYSLFVYLESSELFGNTGDIGTLSLDPETELIIHHREMKPNFNSAVNLTLILKTYS
jgi:hypothetical protein